MSISSTGLSISLKASGPKYLRKATILAFTVLTEHLGPKIPIEIKPREKSWLRISRW